MKGSINTTTEIMLLNIFTAKNEVLLLYSEKENPSSSSFLYFSSLN